MLRFMADTVNFRVTGILSMPYTCMCDQIAQYICSALLKENLQRNVTVGSCFAEFTVALHPQCIAAGSHATDPVYLKS